MGVTAPLRALVLAATASLVRLALPVAVPAVVVAFSGGAARAADDPAANEAKKHYEEGTKAFNLGEYPRAIAEFKATYNAKPDPLLLYNIAQSYRLAGDPGQALFFYKSFLRNMPGAENRKEVEGRIKTLERQVSDQKKDPGAAPSTVIAPTAPPTAPLPTGAPSPAASEPDTVPPTATAAPETKAAADRADAPVRAPYPPPPTVAQAPPGEVDLTTPVPPSGEPSRPIYKKWWFWAGTAGVVLIIGALASANAKKGPSTQLGTFDPTFMP